MSRQATNAEPSGKAEMENDIEHDTDTAIFMGGYKQTATLK